MPEEQVFDAEILGARGGAWVEVPFDVNEVFGSGRPKVQATIDGHPYRGSLAPMGGCHRLGVLKVIRAAIGKDVGDTVHVTLRLDTEPRVVEVPPELVASLAAAPDARDLFDEMSYTHRKEYARWVAEAKKQETRERRAEKAIEMLRAGKRL